jgi:hypothetical protein
MTLTLYRAAKKAVRHLQRVGADVDIAKLSIRSGSKKLVFQVTCCKKMMQNQAELFIAKIQSTKRFFSRKSREPLSKRRVLYFSSSG